LQMRQGKRAASGPGNCDRRTRRCEARPNGSSKRIQESANEDTRDECKERGCRKQGGEGRSGAREGAKGKSRFGNPVRGEPGGDRFVAKMRRGSGKQTGCGKYRRSIDSGIAGGAR